ncbi:hypothetical protein OH146_12190 [Salinibacterium sp. SYSU T00001]|uniref:hypothetical protein n=1 Tax=Homoserinimonas sedimenticola TaxID=2986805 RepID=UPI002235996C|nr:hypothetical protein [Salinibacterium sedimenticola]MCW4386533.1 hypothetical protein [Salinibacterium sedimenticola]
MASSFWISMTGVVLRWVKMTAGSQIDVQMHRFTDSAANYCQQLYRFLVTSQAPPRHVGIGWSPNEQHPVEIEEVDGGHGCHRVDAGGFTIERVHGVDPDAGDAAVSTTRIL